MAESILQGVTTSTPFLSCNRAQTPLFSVNPGVPVADALSVASCLLDEAVIALDCIEDRVPAGAACRLVEMAKAAVDAVADGEPADKPANQSAADRDLLQAALGELKAAHQIIRNAMKLMTLEQKDVWAWNNETCECCGEGVTRDNEREAVIAALEAKGGAA